MRRILHGMRVRIARQRGIRNAGVRVRHRLCIGITQMQHRVSIPCICFGAAVPVCVALCCVVLCCVV